MSKRPINITINVNISGDGKSPLAEVNEFIRDTDWQFIQDIYQSFDVDQGSEDRIAKLAELRRKPSGVTGKGDLTADRTVVMDCKSGPVDVGRFNFLYEELRKVIADLGGITAPSDNL